MSKNTFTIWKMFNKFNGGFQYIHIIIYVIKSYNVIILINRLNRKLIFSDAI